MVPFKPYFLGEEQPPHPRMTTVQKCFRANDIELVGTTSRHCTFFEMLGNFSFGDYFKEGAIRYAWDLVTEVFGLDGDRIWVTVHETDDDAAAVWADAIGLPAAAHPAARRGELLGDGRHRARGGPTASCTWTEGPPTAPTAGPPAGADERLPRVLEPRLHVAEPPRRRDGRGPAPQEHRHRRGARPVPVPPERQGLDLRDRPVRRACSTPPSRSRAARSGDDDGGRRRAAPHRGPRPGDDDARRRRRAPDQRGPRLRAAPRRASRDPRGTAPWRARAGPITPTLVDAAIATFEVAYPHLGRGPRPHRLGPRARGGASSTGRCAPGSGCSTRHSAPRACSPPTSCPASSRSACTTPTASPSS